MKEDQFGVLFYSKEYSKFKTHPANRMIRWQRVSLLMKLMRVRGWLQGSIIIVDRNYIIINGQHRFLAAQETNTEIGYIRLDIDATPELIRENNLHQLNWSIEDTVKGFIAQDYSDYMELDEFRKKHPELKFTDVMMIAKTSTRSAYRHELENGTFKMRNPELSEEWAQRVEAFKPYLDDYNSRMFVRSLTEIFVNPLVDFKELMKKVEKYPYMIKNYKQVERNLEMFEKIYNKGRHKSKRITLRKL